MLMVFPWGGNLKWWMVQRCPIHLRVVKESLICDRLPNFKWEIPMDGVADNATIHS
ncbi:hypothetical protein XBJ1_1608 [Xenorhabdus bovienii SS-2004]|uniref:Uncharacterized protein n=1 Tax=Xenorhabdus bovienii (strain SS-2004) TaxID=406818 RepID=D3V0A1_XENBS|nr:hypothetical protein XBJ1_1608 [Xenorhabdus bovienii SS-2004]